MTQRPKIPQIFINADFTYADAKEAQSIFEAWLAEQRLVYGNFHKKEAFVPMTCDRYSNFQTGDPRVGFNQQTVNTVAYLVCPTELKPQVCEHEPRAAFPFGSIPSDAEHIQWHCKHCGLKLRARWEAE